MKRLFILLVLSSWIAQAMEQDAVFAAAQKKETLWLEEFIAFATKDLSTITQIMSFWQGLRKVIPQAKKCFRDKDGLLDKAKILNLYFKGLVEQEHITALLKNDVLNKSKGRMYCRIKYAAGSFGGAVVSNDILGVMRHCRAGVSPLENLNGESLIDHEDDDFHDIGTISYEKLNERAICNVADDPERYQLFRILAAHTTDNEFESVASELLYQAGCNTNVPVILYSIDRLKKQPEKLKEAIDRISFKTVSFLNSLCTMDAGREYVVALFVQHGADLSVQCDNDELYKQYDSVRDIMKSDAKFLQIMNNPHDEKWKRAYEKYLKEELENKEEIHLNKKQKL